MLTFAMHDRAADRVLHMCLLANHCQAPWQFWSHDVLLLSGPSNKYQLCQTFLVLLTILTGMSSMLSIKACSDVRFVGALELSNICFYFVALSRR